MLPASGVQVIRPRLLPSDLEADYNPLLTPCRRERVEELIAEGDKVVARWRDWATHQGEYMGIPPTGNRVEFTGISVYCLEAGKVAESWNVEDELGLMRQIGAIPELGQ